MSSTDTAREAPQRVMVVWSPDWPVVAAMLARGGSAQQPSAVLAGSQIQVCSAMARAAGVRRGMRKREAQAACPQLVTYPEDPGRDARMFEPVAAAAEHMVAGLEIVRPGLLMLPAHGPARYFGGETEVAERLVDHIASVAEVECQIGIADGIYPAALAAHRGIVVPPNQSPAFLARLSIAELMAEPGRENEHERVELVNLLWRLGLRTLGDFAALPVRDVGARFGAVGVHAHGLACGRQRRAPARRVPPQELSVTQALEPAVHRVDAAAFAARGMAEQLHRQLAERGVACTRLGIYAKTSEGRELLRQWQCAAPLTATSTAERVRWQLEGWLRQPADAQFDEQPGEPPAAECGLTELRLIPEEMVAAGQLQRPLWATDGSGAGFPGDLGQQHSGRRAELDAQAARALSRVQGLLGPDAVCTAVLDGGRDPACRQRWVPWGQARQPRAADQPWPAQLPAPSPAAVMQPPVAIEVLDAYGRNVTVTERGALSAEPATVASNAVQNWAGPWAVDERWWSSEGDGQQVRLHIVLAEQALLISHVQHSWWVEGAYR